MIDFVKIIIRDSKQRNSVWRNPKLEFDSILERRFGDEIKVFPRKKYCGLTFTQYENRLEITGSLHKYFNNGLHNANDFSFTECINVIHELKKVLKLELDKCSIVNLEYGLNIIPLVDVKILIDDTIYHGKNEFRYLPDIKYAKQAGSFNVYSKLNQYKIIKVYAKGLQKHMGFVCPDYNTLRVEVKSKESKYINKLKIKTLEDLLNAEIYYILIQELLKEWDSVIVLDFLLPKSDYRISKYTYRDYWEKSINGSRNKYATDKRAYFALLEKYPDNIHKHVRGLLHEKLILFKNELDRSAFSKGENSANSKHTNDISDADSTTQINLEGYNSIIVKLDSASERCCFVTGFNISMQKPKSIYLTPVGLKWYHDNDPDKYNKIKMRFLPRSGISGRRPKYERNEFAHIAKQIRNYHNNPKRYKSNIECNQITLF